MDWLWFGDIDLPPEGGLFCVTFLSLLLYYTVPVGLPSELSFTSSLKSDQRNGFYERHKPIAVVMILVVFLLPIVGVFVTGLSGGVLGVIVSVAAYFLTPYAVLKLREVVGI